MLLHPFILKGYIPKMNKHENEWVLLKTKKTKHYTKLLAGRKKSMCESSRITLQFTLQTAKQFKQRQGRLVDSRDETWCDSKKLVSFISTPSFENTPRFARYTILVGRFAISSRQPNHIRTSAICLFIEKIFEDLKLIMQIRSNLTTKLLWDATLIK